MGLDGESRRKVGLAVARRIGRPLTDSRLLVDRSPPGETRDPVLDETNAVCRALGGATRVVFTCGAAVFGAAFDHPDHPDEVDDPASQAHDTTDDPRRVRRPRPPTVRRAGELLAGAWVVWIDRSDGAGRSSVEIDDLGVAERRRRAERWADLRIDVAGLGHDELVVLVLDSWRGRPR